MLATKSTKFSTSNPPNLNHQFVENLISLRNRYQSLLEEMERERDRAALQLVHVNALLLDQLVDNESFVPSLMELRNQYQTMAHQCASKASHARTQIDHVNALLADQLVWQHEPLPVSIQASPLNENNNRSLKATADIDSNEFPKQTDAVDEIDAIDETDELAR